MKTTVILASAALGLAVLAGCDRDTATTRQSANDAGREAQREARQATERVGRGAADATKDAQDASNRAGERLREGARDTGDAVRRGTNDLRDSTTREAYPSTMPTTRPEDR